MKGRPRVAVLRRFWQTSIFITYSICGSQAWRQKRAHGDVIVVVRFADDIVVGFHSKADADQFRAELTERMRKFNLELHPEKTRLLEFGPHAIDQRQWRGEGKPETFKTFLASHISV